MERIILLMIPDWSTKPNTKAQNPNKIRIQTEPINNTNKLMKAG